MTNKDFLEIGKRRKRALAIEVVPGWLYVYDLYVQK